MRRLTYGVVLTLALAIAPARADVLASLAIEHAADAATEQPVSPALPQAAVVPYQTVTIMIGGDLGMNASGQQVAPDGVWRHGQRFAVADLTRGLAGRLKADVVFANLETVVTARNDLQPIDKSFNFRSHPNAIRHLVGLGFNVFSAANNHMVDYGEAGMADTVRHLAALGEAGLKAAPGLGFGRAAAVAPSTVTLAQARVLVAAAGIGGASFGGDRAAMASFHSPDLADAARRLQDAQGDIRMLSVHFGQEQQVRPATADERRLRDLAARHDIDLIAGHHTHVAAGVQDSGGRMIFYGLGNLLHPGMRDMAGLGTCRDFGVLARVHFGRSAGAAYRIRGIEVWTLADMHAATRIRSGEEARARLDVLNHHAARLDDLSGGARGVRFHAEPTGSGLACTAHAADHDDDLARRCEAVRGLPMSSAPRGLSAACGTSDVARTFRQPSITLAARPRATERPTLVARSSRFDAVSDR